MLKHMRTHISMLACSTLGTGPKTSLSFSFTRILIHAAERCGLLFLLAAYVPDFLRQRVYESPFSLDLTESKVTCKQNAYFVRL